LPVGVLDACVLFQGGLTNLLLHLAEAKAFEPIWSHEIHAEWMRNLRSSKGIPIDKIEYRRGEMERAFPAANVPAPSTLVATIQGSSKTAAQERCPCRRDSGHRQGRGHRDAQHQGFRTRDIGPL